jgi:DNA polymerase III sliding clamp (beta) subunit (PCNA family)
MLTLRADELKALVRAAVKVIPRTFTLPVLGHVKLESCDGRATVTFTDIEQTLAYSPETAAEGDAAFLCPLSVLQKLAKEAVNGDSVALAPSGTAELPNVVVTATLKGQAIRTETGTMPVNEFPEMLKPIPMETAPVKDLLEAVRIAFNFASTDETRHTLNGVFWDSKAGALIGTDGRRLVMLSVPGLPALSDFILPSSKVLRNGVLSGDGDYCR